jgi:hypothetical protein
MRSKLKPWLAAILIAAALAAVQCLEQHMGDEPWNTASTATLPQGHQIHFPENAVGPATSPGMDVCRMHAR